MNHDTTASETVAEANAAREARQAQERVENGVPDGLTTDAILTARDDLLAFIDVSFPENSRLKAVAKTQIELGFGALLLLRAE